MLYGNQLASAFELARGYTPSLTGSKLLKVPREILEAHKVVVAQRALSKILKMKAVTPVAPKLLTPGTPIYGYVKLQKGHGEWRPYSVISCDGYRVEVRAAKRGPKTLLALEDIRFRPKNDLARSVMEEKMRIVMHSRLHYP